MTNRRLNYLFNTMELYLQREIFTDKSTIGTLFIDGVRECYILEDCDRGLTELMQISEIEKLKVYGETCIPYGRYEVVVTMSNRFKRELPLLLDVKGYTGIRIHVGNSDLDSHGCLLPCKQIVKDKGLQSTPAFNQLFEKIKTAKSRGQKVYITIKKK